MWITRQALANVRQYVVGWGGLRMGPRGLLGLGDVEGWGRYSGVFP